MNTLVSSPKYPLSSNLHTTVCRLKIGNFWSVILKHVLRYVNTSCEVFKRVVQNQKDFCLRINILHTQRKLLNFENWCSGELPKHGQHFDNKVVLDEFWHRKLTLKFKFWHVSTRPHYANSKNSIISFEWICWFLDNFFLILYPPLENSTTRIT